MRSAISIDYISKSDLDRFWSKVDVKDNDSCWEWTAQLRNSGYGRMWYYGSSVSAHRLSWVIHFGPIPKDRLVLHKCNNKLCVNPKHLYLGTGGDNNADMYRSPTPPKAGRVSMFSAEDIQKIKSLRKGGMTQQKIANVFECSRTHILHIVNDNKAFLGVNLRSN